MAETKNLVGLSITASSGLLTPAQMVMAQQLMSNSALTSIGSVGKYINVSLSGFGLTSGFGTYSEIINNTLTDIATPSDSGYVVYNAYIFGPDVYFSDSTEYFEGKTSF